MSVLDGVSKYFFYPLCARNRDLYVECAKQLIERSREIPVLYEADARNCLILYLQNCAYAIADENMDQELGITLLQGKESEVSGARSARENASLILRYFRKCGWICRQEIGRSGDNLATVTPYCRRLILDLEKIFTGGGGGLFENHIYSMYDTLFSALSEGSARVIQPYSSILVPLLEDENELRDELLILKDGIGEIMRMVMQITDINGFGQFFMKDELLNRFFKNYFSVKNNGYIPSYIARIDQMLRTLSQSELFEKMAKEYVTLNGGTLPAARDLIREKFDELDGFVNYEYNQQMDFIDRRINDYYNRYALRISMVLSDKGSLEQELNSLLLFLKNMGEEERSKALLEIGETSRLQSVALVGRKSIQRRKKSASPAPLRGIDAVVLSGEEKKRLTHELMEEVPSLCSLDNVRTYFDLVFEKNGYPAFVTLQECGVEDRTDVMMLAAAFVYSGTEDFPYDVEVGEGVVDTPPARIRRMRIKRRMSE